MANYEIGIIKQITLIRVQERLCSARYTEARSFNHCCRG